MVHADSALANSNQLKILEVLVKIEKQLGDNVKTTSANAVMGASPSPPNPTNMVTINSDDKTNF